MMEKKFLLLNGSPRKNKTSCSFIRTIKLLAEQEGHRAEIIHIIDCYDNRSMEQLKESLTRCDVIGLVSPLYVDTLPSPVIWFLERLAEEFPEELKGKGFFAIGQCGFPDATLCQPLLGSCRCFAAAVKMNWLGGLGYGGGAIIDGLPLETLGGRGRKITAALSLALQDMQKGRTISTEAQDLMAIRIPKLFYRPLAIFLNRRTRKLAKHHGVTDLKRKAYLEKQK